MRTLNLALIVLLLTGSVGAYAGEALVTRVRGSKVTLDTGADAGIMEDMEVSILRPASETVFHPITGEDLGAPEIELGTGRVSKVSEHAATVQLLGGMVLSVRPGDVVRYMTSDDQMLMDEERTLASQEANEQQHKQFSSDLSQLASKVTGIQGQISALRNLVARVERVEEGFRVQLRGINEDLIVMKEDIIGLKDQVALYGPVPINGEGEGPQGGGEPGLTQEDVEMIFQRLAEQTGVDASPALAMDETPPMVDEFADDLGLDEGLPDAEEEPFYAQTWFFLILGTVGIAAVTAFAALRMTGETDDDDEEDEELEEDDEDIEIEVEESEEDDIVIEETS
jgi:hypothetical protein